MSIEEIRQNLKSRMDQSHLKVNLQSKVEFAENWLEKNWDQLNREGKENIALEALSRYEKLCDQLNAS